MGDSLDYGTTHFPSSKSMEYLEDTVRSGYSLIGLPGNLRRIQGRSASSVSLWFIEDGAIRPLEWGSLAPGKDGGGVRRGFLVPFEKQEPWKPGVAGPRVPAGEQSPRKRVMEIQ